MFNVGDSVRHIQLGYTGTVVGYHNYKVQVKRDDGVVGASGKYWQTTECSFELVNISLINE